MKKTVLAVVGIVGFSGVLATQQAFAEDINVNYTSNGAITFEPDTDPTKPVNPTNPDEKVEPEDPTDPTGPKPGTADPYQLTMLQAFNLAPKNSLPIRKIITHKFKHLKMEQQVPTMFR